MNLVKNIRLLVFLILVLAALVIVILPTLTKPTGVVVSFVGDNVPCKDVITVGSTITEIAGNPVRDSTEFEQALQGLEGTVTFIINNNPRSCLVPKNLALDVKVKEIKKIGLKLSTEIGGGKVYSFKPEETLSSTLLQQLVDTLKFRANKYGLQNTKIERTDSELIKIIMGKEEENYVELLTKNGVLEGKITKKVMLINKKGEVTIGDNSYDVVLKGKNTLLVDDSKYEVGDSIILDGLRIQIENISSNHTVFVEKIFDERDLTIVEGSRTSSGGKRIIKQGNLYVFAIPVSFSIEASENFAKATKGQEVSIDPRTGESFLKNPIVVSIDDEIIVELPAKGDDAGKNVVEFIIWGYRQGIEDATDEMVKLTTTIESKRLPVKLMLEEESIFSPEKGGVFFSLPLYTLLTISIVTSVFFFAKYHKKGVIVVPFILLVIGELVLILGSMVLEWFVIFLFLFGFVLAAIKSEVRGWYCWLTIFLTLIIIVGITMGKWILGVPSVIGLIFVMIYSTCQMLYMGLHVKKKEFSQNVYRNLMQKNWWSLTIVTLVLFSMFFLNFYREFTMTFLVGAMISTVFVIPIFGKIMEKINK